MLVRAPGFANPEGANAPAVLLTTSALRHAQRRAAVAPAGEASPRSAERKVHDAEACIAAEPGHALDQHLSNTRAYEVRQQKSHAKKGAHKITSFHNRTLSNSTSGHHR